MSTATVTGKAGPNIAVTAVVYTGVTQFDMNSDNNILTIWQGTKATMIAIEAAVTITVTVAGGQYTLTVANS
jgi:hypothetical protein